MQGASTRQLIRAPSRRFSPCAQGGEGFEVVRIGRQANDAWGSLTISTSAKCLLHDRKGTTTVRKTLPVLPLTCRPYNLRIFPDRQTHAGARLVRDGCSGRSRPERRPGGFSRSIPACGFSDELFKALGPIHHASHSPRCPFCLPVRGSRPGGRVPPFRCFPEHRDSTDFSRVSPSWLLACSVDLAKPSALSRPAARKAQSHHLAINEMPVN